MEHIHAWGTHWHWFWMVPLLFMFLMLVTGSFMCRRTRRWRSAAYGPGRGRMGWCGPGSYPAPNGWTETPREILERRYASGEITEEEFERVSERLRKIPPDPPPEA